VPRASTGPSAAARAEDELYRAEPIAYYNAPPDPSSSSDVHTVMVDVGPPLGDVLLDDKHPATGTHLTIPNSVWEPKAPGTSACVVQGRAVKARIGKHRLIFVVRECASHVSYPFTAVTLRSLLPAELRHLADA
jgi:hypothetical protein